MAIKISIVVPTYNRVGLLKNCLQSLITQSIDNYEIIVVDDGSTDGTSELISNIKSQISNIRCFTQEHKGASAARNLGIAHAEGEIIAFTDSDCIADKDWLKEIVASFSEGVVGVSGKVVTDWKKVTPFTHQVVSDGNVFASCNIACKKEALLEVGGFDERFIYGHEDTDLYIRLAKVGKIIYAQNAIVTHPPVPLGFMGFIKRMAISYRNESLLYSKHPELYRGRSLICALIRVLGVRGFFMGLKSNIPFVYRNPVIYLLYLTALILQRLYLALLILNGKRNLRK